MQNPQVTITDVTGDPMSNEKGKGVNLGDAKLNGIANGLISEMRQRARKILHLQWEGSKIPRGAVIDGTEIVWTQNGQVTGAGGKSIGTYERLVEFGGFSGNDQQMLVFVA